MTDARLRGPWIASMVLDDLSDRAWRVFTRGLMWCAENGTDGFVPTRYLKLLHPDGEFPDANDELEVSEIWEKTDGGYQFRDWDGELGQSTAAQVEANRENARERQRRFRERERKKAVAVASKSKAERASDTSDATRPVTRDVGKGSGAGKGEGKGEGSTDDVTTSVTTWATRKPGTSEWVEGDDGEWSEVG